MYKFHQILISLTIFVRVITSKDLNYSVAEERGKDVFLGNVAVDADLRSAVTDEADFKTLRFNFLTQGYQYTSYFKIDEQTGDLKTAKNIDREEICVFSNECDIPLEVAASGIGVFFQKIKITVHIIDMNDNRPNFTSSILHLSISEASHAGSEFNIEGATDRDSLNYSVKSYRVDPPGTPFEAKFTRNLDGTSVVKLTISKALDREIHDNYQIQLIAIDGGNQTGSLTVNITVTDVNDNPPVFSKKSYNVTVQEDIALNKTILIVSASDLDIGKNGEITYRISSNQPINTQKLFSIEATSGELKVIGNLMYELNKPYQLIVEALDKGDQPRVSQAYVYVNVLDSENNPPIIKINLLSDTNMSRISEYANMGAVVAHVAVEDKDTGRNGLVTCSITSGYFQLQRLDVNEYKVIVQNPLDRELISEHYVSIYCRDVGSPPLDSRASFKVEVLDENDHSPKFTNEIYNASITENNNLDAVILQVNAGDLDSGINARITYHLHSDAGSSFSIHPDTGVIRTNKVFDREIKSEYKFRVFAVDGGKEPRSSTAVVVLTIGDVNDNAPQFTQTAFKATVQENLRPDANVTKVYATDRDFDMNGLVTFSMKYDKSIPFMVFPDGTIKTTAKLDRENISQYIFSVVARDQGNPPLSNTVDVTVMVGDANDNSPVITYPNASNDTITIPYAMRLNSVIAVLKAHDIDIGKNKELVYYIKSRNDSDFFNLNSRTGEIIIAKQLNEKNIDKYLLQIAISDQGTPRQTSLTKFFINVVLKNITSVTPLPQLEEQPYNVAIVVTVVVVTLVLSASILVTIFIIKRLDQQKKKYSGEVLVSGNKPPNPQVAQYIITDGKGSTYSAPGERIGVLCSYSPEPTLDKMSVSSQNTNIQVYNKSYYYHLYLMKRNSSYKIYLCYFSLTMTNKNPMKRLKLDFHMKAVTHDSGICPSL